MQFEFTSGWVILSLLGYGVATLIAIYVLASNRRRRYDPYYNRIDKHPWWKGLRPAIATFVVLSVVGNCVTYGLSHLYATPSQNSHEVATVFGFESGKEYPLALGSRLGGSSIDVSGYRSSFTVREKAGSMVSIGFSNEGRSYILEIPVSKTTFVVDNEHQPTMRLYLTKEGYGSKQVIHESSCAVVVHWFLVTCDRTVEFGINMSEEDMRQGLGDVVQKSFSSAELTLTQQMYDAVLGKK